jgi:hypothetical protein
MARKRFQGSMGVYPDKSYIELEASVEVWPSSVGVPDEQKRRQTGYYTREFDEDLHPVDIPVYPDTEGTIRIWSTVYYYFWEWPEGTAMFPREREDSVKCQCIWKYGCTMQGEISFRPFDPQDSQTSDHFTVRVKRPDWSNPKPMHDRPFVVMIEEYNYAGTAAGADIEIPLPKLPGPFAPPKIAIPGAPGTSSSSGNVMPLYAYLNVVDDEKPDPAPLPRIERTFYFERENETTFLKNTKPENTLRALDDWCVKLKAEQPELWVAMKQKIVKVQVKGFASPPGPYEYNSDISDARAAYVEANLNRNWGTGTVEIHRGARGNRDAIEQPGVKPNQRDAVYINDRRVKVVINPLKTEE